jgi:uncharacterized protein DUF4234
MPWGAPPAPGGPLAGAPGVRPGVLQERNPVHLILLSLVTCGIYSAYWLYLTTRELRDALDQPNLNPTVDLVLSIVTCGLWSIYAHFRNAGLVYRAQTRFEPSARDQSVIVLMLDVAAIFTGVTWLIALFVLQDEHNRLARLSEGRR